MSVDQSGPGGVARNHHSLRAATAALLIGCAAIPSSDGWAAATVQPAPDDPNREIVVTAPFFRDLTPERQLDREGIDSYAASTIDELLGEVQVELGEEAEQPLILVNGKRINNLAEIGALPVEVLRNLEVLPRGSAVRLGGTSGQRVVNLSLNRVVRSATLTAAPKIATDGDYSAIRGEALLTRVSGDKRANLAFRTRRESNLLESERDIIQPTPSTAPAGINNGDYRTLRPRTRNYDVNGTYATPLTSWLSASTTLRWNRNQSTSLRGIPKGLTEPLEYRGRRVANEANLTLNADWGKWTGNFNGQHRLSRDRSFSERAATAAGVVGIQTDELFTRNLTDLAQLTLNGPAFTLPAGPALATIEGRVQRDRVVGTSTFSSFGNRNARRSEQAFRAAIDVPLTSRANGFGEALGDLNATAEFGRSHFSDAGTLGRGSVGLTWEPKPFMRLRAAYEESELPAQTELLGGPVFVNSNVRVFDPLTGQTVDVTQITGGIPDLLPQKTKIKRFNALFRLVPRLNLQLNGEYTDTDRRNFVSGLPEASAAVMLAFPDRYVRDSSGTLIRMDLRPVNFASDREKRLRWGFSMNTRLNGAQVPPAPKRGAPRAARRPATYLQLTANHSVVFSDRIVIREGLEPVDLLGGGAIGIGGGRLRHQIDATAALTSGGMGIRGGLTWRGPSRLVSRIGGVDDTLKFSPVMLINLRAFADMKRLLPKEEWAKGFRISLDVLNLTNDRQSVRNSFGTTPLQYQAGYRDPVGRTIELEIRKVF